MLLYKVIQRRKEELRLFAASGSQLGFIGELTQLYSEFKRYEVHASALEEGLKEWGIAANSPILEDKLHDLNLIYHDYEKELVDLYIDDEDTLNELTGRLPDSTWLQEQKFGSTDFMGLPHKR